jgi:hypothetical protein
LAQLRSKVARIDLSVRFAPNLLGARLHFHVLALDGVFSEEGTDTEARFQKPPCSRPSTASRSSAPSSAACSGPSADAAFSAKAAEARLLYRLPEPDLQGRTVLLLSPLELFSG